MAIIYQLHPNLEPAKLIETLQANPRLKLTLVFPPHYFEQESKKTAIDSFRILESSGQIEIALTLDNEPVLPLLANLKTAGEKVSKWGFNFTWLDDVSFQIARGSGKHQKMWGKLPSGLVAPNGALSEPVIQTLKRFRLNWVLGQPFSTSGVRFYGATALVIPTGKPDLSEWTYGTRAWAKNLLKWVTGQSFTYLDNSLWETEEAQNHFLSELAEYVSHHPDIMFQLSQTYFETISESTMASDNDPFKFDYSPWVGHNRQKRAWQTLAEARNVLEIYRNSGNANLQRLDAATEEIATAESGSLFLSLGNPEIDPEDTERIFLATVGNVYRLCNIPLPANFNNIFIENKWQRSTIKPLDMDRPFFIEGAQSLTWNDPLGDDNGNGKFIYPTGIDKKGMFDLRDFTLSWTDTLVTFSYTVGASIPNKLPLVVPLLDIYIDINKLSGAGSLTPLRKRPSLLISKPAAWEYAVSVGAQNASLSQSVFSSNPRLLQTQKTDSNGQTFSCQFPRKLLRGDPGSWRLSVALMGTEVVQKLDEPLPIPVLSTTGSRNFGGGQVGKTAPPVIDLLCETVEEQKDILAQYESGLKITLPFMEGR
jgi:hypothetical protein